MDSEQTPPPFTIRASTLADLEPVLALRQAREIAENGPLVTTAEALRSAWQALGERLGEQVWVAVTPDGLRACMELGRVGAVFTPCLWVDQRLQRQREAMLALLARAERQVHATAHAEGSASVELFAQATSLYPAMGGALLDAGYTISSTYEKMERALSEPPPAPAAIVGVAIRPFSGERDAEAVYRADEEAFQDQRGHLPRSFEQWGQRLSLGAETHDPALWLIAWDGDEVAGAALGETLAGVGWINHLFVRRPWRRRGLGAALTRAALGAFYRAGVTAVRLNVDAQSLTNAHLLYRREDFRVTGDYANYQKRAPLTERR